MTIRRRKNESDTELAARVDIAARQRFAASLRKRGSCVEWAKSTTTTGYGKFSLHAGGWMLAHRAAYEMHVGSIPDGMVVCHRCDNPRCVRPEHLFVGTMADNQQDMAQKGRSTRGEKNPMARLTEADVREIRNKHAAGVKRDDLCAQWGVSLGCVSGVVDGINWRHVS